MSLFGRKGEDLTSSFQRHVAEGVSLLSLPGKASGSWERKEYMLCLWLLLLVWKAVTPCTSPASELFYLAGAGLEV